MKPKIGQTVYILCHGYIDKDEVGYLGKHSFIIDGYENKYNQEHFYEDFGNTWFNTLREVKEKYPKLKHVADGEWMVVEEEK